MLSDLVYLRAIIGTIGFMLGDLVYSFSGVLCSIVIFLIFLLHFHIFCLIYVHVEM